MTLICPTGARKALILGVLGLIFGLAEARAGFTVVLDSTTLNNSNELTTFNYSIATTAFDKLTAGDSFTINNFAGYENGTITSPGNWQLATALNPTNPADSNLTFTFIGAAPITGPTTMTGFSAVSQLAGASIGTFDASITSTSGLSVPTSSGQVYVPGTGTIGPAPAPEPSSLVLGGIAAVVFALTYARRRRPC